LVIHIKVLFLVKEESRVELGDDFFILIVAKLQKVGDAMEITCFNNYVERGILLLPHVIKVDPLHWDDRLGLSSEHYIIPILVKESPEVLIGAPFLGLGVANFLTHFCNLG
jgi:hypothetical protein